MPYNTTVDLEMIDGTVVKCTLTYGYLIGVKAKVPDAYKAYNDIISSSTGIKDEFDSLRILYTGYLCGLVADKKPLDEAMSFEDFYNSILPDRFMINDALAKIFFPKKAMASADPLIKVV